MKNFNFNKTNFKRNLINLFILLRKQFSYSLKIIFANKFVYFFTAAVIFFLLVVVINFFSASNTKIEDIYYMLLFPGILLVFYPTTFGIQNDDDSRMLENIFAIPNYRFKVWLPRIAMVYVLVFLLLVFLTAISSIALAAVPIIEMVYQLMFPIFFLGSLAFAVSTLVKNGNGAAVIMVIIGMIFWISSGLLQDSAWNIFLNPFDLPDGMDETIWNTVITSNRLYLSSGALLSILYGLFNLQKREKFI